MPLDISHFIFIARRTGPKNMSKVEIQNYASEKWLHFTQNITRLVAHYVALAHPRMARQGEVIPREGFERRKKAEQMNRMNKQAYS